MSKERFTTRTAVFVVVRNDKGEILLQQRGGSVYLSGYWDFPSGHGEHAESLRESAIRELQEEVGIKGRAEDLKLVHIDQYFAGVNYINFIFDLPVWNGEPRVCEPDKCTAVGWFALDALPEKCVNAVQAVAAEGFSDELSYSITDPDILYGVMGLPR